VTSFRVFASLGALPLFAAAGLGLVAFVPALRGKPLAPRLGWAFLLGVAWNGLALFTMSRVLHVSLRRSTILPVLLLPAAFALVWRFRRIAGEAPALRPAEGPLREPLVLAPAAVGTALFVALLVHALSVAEDGYDPMMTWDPHAAYVREARTVDAPIFLEKQWFLNNPRYPLLMPLMQVAIREVFDTSDDVRIPRPAYAAFYSVFLLILFDAAAPLAGRRAASVATLVAALLPLLNFQIDGGAVSSYSDLPLGLFWGAGLVLLIEAPLSWTASLSAGLLLGAAANAKAEGLLLALVALGAAGVSRLAGLRPGDRSRALKTLLGAGAVVAFCAALYLSWRASVPNRFSESWERVTPYSLAKGVIRAVPKILGPIGHEMNVRPVWERFWWMAPVVLVAGARALRRRESLPFLAALAGGLVVYFASYGGTLWDPAELVHPTWNRFMIQLALPFFIVFTFCLREALFPQDPTMFRRSARESVPAFAT
jgi:hypothetical protein